MGNDVRRIFLYDIVPNLLSREINMPYIKFVFDSKTLKRFEKFLKVDWELIEHDEGVKAYKYLCKVAYEYENCEDIDEDIYIKINDPTVFFNLLNKLIREYELRDNKRLYDSKSFIRSIWLRMGVDDINDVEGFLKRQLSFSKNDDLISYDRSKFMEYDGLDIMAYNDCNDDWFETNNNFNFYIRNRNYNMYGFPSIHYGLSFENGKVICYIYGIQYINEFEKNEEIKRKIQPIRKKLNNKYVSPDFVMVLELFFDFLYQNGIEDVRVPLLQVYNYVYHEYISDDLCEVFGGYTDSEKEEFDLLYESGDRTDKILDYEHNKKMYGKFAFKADIISKNKTERLVETFEVIQDKIGNIEIENEPFIQGDTLRVKINDSSSLFSTGVQKKKIF